IFDVRVEAAVLVHDEHAWQLAGRSGWPREIALDAAVALRRGDRLVIGPDALVVLRHLLSPGVVGLQALPDRRDRQPADGELADPIEKRSAIDLAVLVFVEDVQQLLRVIGRFLSFHRWLLSQIAQTISA